MFADEGSEEPAKEVEKTDTEETIANPLVLMQTNYGDITIEVFEKEMPVHGGNFLKLVDQGFYDSLTFHRIVKGFVIQGGDPEGTGMGGAPGKLADEESPFKHDRATIAMARGASATKVPVPATRPISASVSLSWMTTKCQGCWLRELGAHRAA